MSITQVTGMMQTGTKGGDIPSAGTMVIDTDGDYFDITGTTGITGMTVAAGRRFTLQFDGAVTITDNAAITLSGAANFTTAAGDILSFIAVAANTVVQTGYSLVDGGSPVAPSGGGAWTLIGSQAITNSTSVTQTGLTSTYDTYAILLSDLLFDTNNDAMDIRLGDSSGVDSGSTDYQHCSTNIGSDDSTDVVYSDGASKMRLLNNIQDTTAAGVAAIIYLHAPTDGVTWPHITFQATGNYGDKVRASSGAGARKAVIAVDRVNIFCYYDNGIISGRMSVYGIKHT